MPSFFPTIHKLGSVSVANMLDDQSRLTDDELGLRLVLAAVFVFLKFFGLIMKKQCF